MRFVSIPAPATAFDQYNSSILAFYPIDEPLPSLIASGAYGTLVKAIKASAPHIPIAAVVTPSDVRGIEFGAYALPPEVDWVGGDQYGCWAEEECATRAGGAVARAAAAGAAAWAA